MLRAHARERCADEVFVEKVDDTGDWEMLALQGSLALGKTFGNFGHCGLEGNDRVRNEILVREE